MNCKLNLHSIIHFLFEYNYWRSGLENKLSLVDASCFPFCLATRNLTCVLCDDGGEGEGWSTTISHGKTKSDDRASLQPGICRYFTICKTSVFRPSSCSQYFKHVKWRWGSFHNSKKVVQSCLLSAFVIGSPKVGCTLLVLDICTALSRPHCGHVHQEDLGLPPLHTSFPSASIFESGSRPSFKISPILD